VRAECYCRLGRSLALPGTSQRFSDLRHASCDGIMRRCRLLTVAWLVELNLKAARHTEVSHEAVTLIDDRSGKFDTA